MNIFAILDLAVFSLRTEMVKTTFLLLQKFKTLPFKFAKMKIFTIKFFVAIFLLTNMT
jgi:hypothetical protein